MESDFRAPPGNRLLQQVREGMEVRDAGGQSVGRVDGVFFGEVSQMGAETGKGAATPSAGGRASDDLEVWAPNVAEPFTDSDRLPEPVRARLLRQGYVRLTRGPLSSHRYALPEQIADVTGNEVRLSVSGDELIVPD